MIPNWYKIKGYYHISPPSPHSWRAINNAIHSVTNPNYVKKYAFYPLLHTKIKVRRYKKHPSKKGLRCHSYSDENKGKQIKTAKERPLHYANHRDALIFGYYASILQAKYEEVLSEKSELSNCITAYRKIPVYVGNDKNKGSIHFAHEVFTEIKSQTRRHGVIGVMAFDIKSFFSSLDHNYLHETWLKLIQEESMPSDHKAVFKAATQFSFIYKDDLRLYRKKKGKRANFDEQKISQIGNEMGFKAYFSSTKEFRDQVKSGKFRIYKNPFKNSSGKTIGIPQGLPISSILANLYLLEFDSKIFDKLVIMNECYYRRYSDDIVVICRVEQMHMVKSFIEDQIRKCHVEISKEKTESFIFKKEVIEKSEKVVVAKQTDEGLAQNVPLTYLGFEFYGDKTLIKSANLSKFYRRMIYAIKSKSKIVKNKSERTGAKETLYKRQLYKLYRNIDLDHQTKKRTFKKYVAQDNGAFKLIVEEREHKSRGNYLTYAKRAAEIMNEPAILKQIEGEKRVFNQALQRHFNERK